MLKTNQNTAGRCKNRPAVFFLFQTTALTVIRSSPTCTQWTVMRSVRRSSSSLSAEAQNRQSPIFPSTGMALRRSGEKWRIYVKSSRMALSDRSVSSKSNSLFICVTPCVFREKSSTFFYRFSRLFYSFFRIIHIIAKELSVYTDSSFAIGAGGGAIEPEHSLPVHIAQRHSVGIAVISAQRLPLPSHFCQGKSASFGLFCSLLPGRQQFQTDHLRQDQSHAEYLGQLHRIVKQHHPRGNVPTVPIPVQAAQAVPKGRCLSTAEKKAKLAVIPTTVTTLGTSLEKPWEYFRLTAHTVSKGRPQSDRSTASFHLLPIIIIVMGKTRKT